MLTLEQSATLRDNIAADGALSVLPNDSDTAFAIAAIYNTAASPAFTVWKTNVSIGEVGRKFNGSELAGLTTGNQSRLQTIAAFLTDGVNPSLIDNRIFFDDVFSGAGGTNTRANLLALWKRLALRIEKLFATGTGSDAAPGTMAFEGQISYADVLEARSLV